MNRSHRIIKTKTKYTTNIEYASGITGLTFIVNPSYTESKYVAFDYELQHSNYIKLKTKHEKGTPLFSSYPRIFSDEILWTSVTCFCDEPNKLYRVDSKNLMALNWYAIKVFQKSTIPTILRFITYYNQSITNKDKQQRKIIKKKNKSIKSLKKRMINPREMTLQYGSYLGMSIFSNLRKGKTKLPHMSHTHCMKMWYLREGESYLQSLCDKPKRMDGDYDIFGPMSRQELSKWIATMYLENETKKHGKFVPDDRIIVKYNKKTHWMQILFTVRRDDEIGRPHGIYLEL